MPSEVIARARREADSDTTSVEQLLGELQRERDALASERKAEESARAEAEEIRQGLAERRAAIEAERDGILAKAERAMEDELAALRPGLPNHAQGNRTPALPRHGGRASGAPRRREPRTPAARAPRTLPAPPAHPAPRKANRSNRRSWASAIMSISAASLSPAKCFPPSSTARWKSGWAPCARGCGWSRSNGGRPTAPQPRPPRRASRCRARLSIRAPRSTCADAPQRRPCRWSIPSSISPIAPVNRGWKWCTARAPGRCAKPCAGLLREQPLVTSFESAAPRAGGDGVTVVQLVR